MARASALRLAALAALAGGAAGARLISQAVAEVRRVPREPLVSDVLQHALSFVPLLVATCPGTDVVTLWQGRHTGSDAWPVRKLRHSGPVRDVVFFPSGDRLLAIGPWSATIWDTWSGAVVQELAQEEPRGRLPSLQDAQVLPDGVRVVTVSSDGTATIWSSETGEVLQSLDLRVASSDHRRAGVFPHGIDLLATGVSDILGDPVVVWNLTSGLPLRLLAHPWERVRSFVVSPCGGKVAVAGFKRISVWGVPGGELLRVLSKPEEEPQWDDSPGPFKLAVSEAAAAIAAADAHQVYVWDARTGALTRTMPVEGIVGALVLAPAGDRLVTFTSREAVVSEEGKDVRELEGSALGFVAKVSASGDVVAACAMDRVYSTDSPLRLPEVRRRTRTSVWDMPTGRLMHSFHDPSYWKVQHGETEWPCSVAVAPLRTVLESSTQ